MLLLFSAVARPAWPKDKIVARKPNDWAADLGRMRELLYGLLGSDDRSPEPIVEMLKILDRLETTARTATSSQPAEQIAPAAPSFRRNKPKSYRIEQRGKTPFLAEYRKGGRQPYLVPQDVYEALAAEMAGSSEPAHFEILMEGVARRLGRAQPDYLLRTCIRFWMATDPPLVEKIRTRYRAIRPATFLRDARKAWRQAAAQE